MGLAEALVEDGNGVKSFLAGQGILDKLFPLPPTNQQPVDVQSSCNLLDECTRVAWGTESVSFYRGRTRILIIVHRLFKYLRHETPKKGGSLRRDSICAVLNSWLAHWMPALGNCALTLSILPIYLRVCILQVLADTLKSPSAVVDPRWSAAAISIAPQLIAVSASTACACTLVRLVKYLEAAIDSGLDVECSYSIGRAFETQVVAAQYGVFCFSPENLSEDALADPSVISAVVTFSVHIAAVCAVISPWEKVRSNLLGKNVVLNALRCLSGDDARLGAFLRHHLLVSRQPQQAPRLELETEVLDLFEAVLEFLGDATGVIDVMLESADFGTYLLGVVRLANQSRRSIRRLSDSSTTILGGLLAILEWRGGSAIPYKTESLRHELQQI